MFQQNRFDVRMAYEEADQLSAALAPESDHPDVIIIHLSE